MIYEFLIVFWIFWHISFFIQILLRKGIYQDSLKTCNIFLDKTYKYKSVGHFTLLIKFFKWYHGKIQKPRCVLVCLNVKTKKVLVGITDLQFCVALRL